MGTTSKPLRILVLDQDLYESPEVRALKDKGHPVHSVNEAHGTSVTDYDLILGRRAWYMDSKHLPYLEKVTVPAVRARVYNREKETKKK